MAAEVKQDPKSLLAMLRDFGSTERRYSTLGGRV